MIQGEDGRQRRELLKLVRWLKQDVRPDLVHLSNVMLVGSARLLAEELNVPVVSTLNGEDTFIERLPQPYYGLIREELRRRCADLDSLMAMSRYSAEFMAEYLGFSRDKIQVIPPGINLEGHGRGKRLERSGEQVNEPIVLGFLSRICPEKGLHRLAKAFAQLADDLALPKLVLRAAGYLQANDHPYLEGIRADLENHGLGDRFEYIGAPDRDSKIRFLQSLDIMCLPTSLEESKPLAVLEAWANGIPVVLPNHGAFSEMVEDTRGGLMYEANNPESLANALREMILAPEYASKFGRQAQEAVHDRYNSQLMAKQTAAWYERVLAENSQDY
jgi:glycosyltransferase involved in cell wall biosynthesis